MRKITEEFFIQFGIDSDATETNLLDDYTHYASVSDALIDCIPGPHRPNIIYRITPVKIVRAGEPVIESINKKKMIIGEED